MRFLANENFPSAGVNCLREAGYDVAAIIEDSPGAKDREVLARGAKLACGALTVHDRKQVFELREGRSEEAAVWGLIWPFSGVKWRL